MRYRLVAIFSLLLASGAVAMPNQLMSQLHWRFVGPFRGGRVLAVTGVATKPNTYYFGSVDGGVFKSTNGGESWVPLFQHKPVASIGAIAIAPSNPAIIYIGTGESAIRSDISYGDGVWRSTDGGKTWQHMGLGRTRHISAIVVNRHNPNTVVVAALGHAFGPNKQRGVFRTTDGGKHWTKTLYINDHTGVIDLVRDPSHPNRLYATTWDAHRPPWSQYPPIQHPQSRIYRSNNDGKTWHRLETTGLPKHISGRMGLAVAPKTNGKRIYAVVGGQKHCGIYRSDDTGHKWHLLNNHKRLCGRGWYFGHIYVNPKNPNVVYVPNTALYKSSDGGQIFHAIKGTPAGDDFHSLWIDRQNPNRMMLGADQGVGVSVDGGKTWTNWYNQPTAQIYRVATDNAFPYNIYGSQQDSGSIEIPSRSSEGIITNRSWKTSAGGESGYVLPDPNDPEIVYGSGYGGSLERLNKRTHQEANISPWPVNTFGKRPDQARHYYPWTTAVALSPFNGNTLYVGARVLFKSTDQGNEWRIISPDLTGYHRHAQCHGHPTKKTAAACGYAVIYTIAPSGLKHGQLWVGTTDGKVWLTRNGGKHWKNVTPPQLKPWSRIDRIEASPFNPATAYLAVDRHRVGDLTPYIFRTQDYGKHWTRINQGIPTGAYVHVVRADPVRHGLLFAGTETGVFISFDNGNHWQSLQDNLPTVSIRDMQIHDNDLILGTHGRGFWVMDDISSLRQIKPGFVGQQAILLKPTVAYRLKESEYHGEPMPPDIPHASNPPTGAILEYYLGKAVHGPVTLSIYNDKGRLVRRYDSNTKLPKRPLQNFNPAWEGPRVHLSAKPGMHRFIWNLRSTPPQAPIGYAGALVLHGTPLGPLGPLVLPGEYRVVLTANGHKYSEPLTVKLDPRVKATVNALRAQRDLGVSITHSISRATRLIRQAKSDMRRAQKSGNSRQVHSIKRLMAKSNVTGARNQLLGLLHSVEAADVAPPNGVQQAARYYERQVEAASKALGSHLK